MRPVEVVAVLVEGPAFTIKGGPRAAIDDRRVFLARRKTEGRHGGLWELPGGKVEAGESLETALRREIREELGVDLLRLGAPMRYVTCLDDRDFAFTVFPASFDGAPSILAAHEAAAYFSAAEIPWDELAPLDGDPLRVWARGVEAASS